MQATMIKTQDAQTMGTYVPTDVDRQKESADFRIIDMTIKSSIRIAWQDGTHQDVTSRQLEKLESEYASAVDF